MDNKAQRLFESFHMFRKLHFHYLMSDLTQSEFTIMKCIAHGKFHKFDKGDATQDGNMSISKLATMTHVSSPSISRSLKGMEEKGYLIRHINQRDRRNAYVELTDLGKEILQKAEKMVMDFTDNVLDQMNQEHLEHLIMYLEDLYSISQKELDSRKKEK